MALIYADRVKETTTTTETGPIALGGAVAKFRTFADAMSTNDTCFYVVEHASANEWEVGIGTFTSPSTLARTTVLKSSNANSWVVFSAGTKVVGLTVSASAYDGFANDIIPIERGGTGIDASGTGGANQFLKQSTLGGNVSVGTIGIADIATPLRAPTAIGIDTPSTGNFTAGSFTSLGINATPSATQEAIFKAESAVITPLTLQGETGQSANLMTLLDISSTVLAFFDLNGWLGIGDTPSSRSSNLALGRTTTLTGSQRTIYARMIANHSVAPTSTSMRGIDAGGETASGNSTSFTGLILYGLLSSSVHRGSGTLGTAIGNTASVTAVSGAGPITNAYGLTALITNASASTITLAVGLSIASSTNSGGGAITTLYGIKVENQTVGTTSYAIFTGTGLNRFGDQILIIGSADRNQLIVRGNATQTTNLQAWQTSASVVVASVDNSGGAVFNENGTSTGDVRIEGDTDANLLFTDASADSVGIKTNTPNSRLQVNGSMSRPTRTVSADYTPTIDDCYLFVDTTCRINLPSAVGISGRDYFIKNIGVGVTVTIDANGTETIDGALTQVIATQWTSITIVSHNNNWYIV